MAVQSSFRNMTLCLLVICFVCSALLAGVNVLTEKPIAAAAKAKTENAIAQVVPPFEVLSDIKEIEVDGTAYQYYEVSASGSPCGYAVLSSTTGFGGTLSLMVGLTSDGKVYNTSVLSHSETPGLGAKCTDSSFSSQFKNWNPYEKKLSVRKDGGDVDAITASTITSRAYTLAVANAVKAWTKITGNSFDAPSGASAAKTSTGGQGNE